MIEPTSNARALQQTLATESQHRHKERFVKLVAMAGFYFFLVKGMLWVFVPWLVYHAELL